MAVVDGAAGSWQGDAARVWRRATVYQQSPTRDTAEETLALRTRRRRPLVALVPHQSRLVHTLMNGAAHARVTHVPDCREGKFNEKD